MRKITQQITHAFQHRYAFKISNSRTDGDSLWLFNNKIAEWRTNGLWVSNGGWNSKTTKERLNGLTGVHVQQVRGNWFLNDMMWDGDWVNVDAWSNGHGSIRLEVTDEPEFDLTNEWTNEGYSRPVYGIYYSLVESDLEAVEVLLAGGGIPTRRMETDTEGQYKPNYFVIVQPERVADAAKIMSEVYLLS